MRVNPGSPTLRTGVRRAIISTDKGGTDNRARSPTITETKGFDNGYATGMTTIRRPRTGRRRNEAASETIRAAAAGLLAEGATSVSVDTIAAATGVGKQTISAGGHRKVRFCGKRRWRKPRSVCRSRTPAHSSRISGCSSPRPFVLPPRPNSCCAMRWQRQFALRVRRKCCRSSR